MAVSPSTVAQERYAALVAALRESPSVTHTPPTGGGARRFGAGALKVGGKIFAMLVNDQLVVKLPQQRVDMLIAGGDGVRFDPGHGRLMREWLAVAPTNAQAWLPLAQEALVFVGGQR
jgi:hypothetical protein